MSIPFSLLKDMKAERGQMRFRAEFNGSKEKKTIRNIKCRPKNEYL